MDAAVIPEQIGAPLRRPDMERIVGAYGNAVLRMCFLYLKDSHLPRMRHKRPFKSKMQLRGNLTATAGEKYGNAYRCQCV